MSGGIGTTQAAIVFGVNDVPVGVVTSIDVVARPAKKRGVVKFTGPSQFDRALKEHIRTVIEPICSRVRDRLGLEPRRYEVSASNVAATSSLDTELAISGFSADAAIVAAMLSAGLGIALPADVVIMGHIASLAGQVMPVEGMSAKLDACAAHQQVARVVCPWLDRDGSLASLAPRAREDVLTAIAKAKSQLTVDCIGDVFGLAQHLFAEHAIVLGGLTEQYFDARIVLPSNSDPVDQLASWLGNTNDRRFWNELSRLLIVASKDNARVLLETRLAYEIARKWYPRGFGMHLKQLVHAIPPGRRRLSNFFPLAAMNKCIELSRFATDSDHNDVAEFMNAVTGKVRVISNRCDATGERAVRSIESTLDDVLHAIGIDAITAKLLEPIDRARACYSLDSVVASSNEEFQDTIEAFYTHTLRHMDVPETVGEQTIGPESLALVDRAFSREGGIDAAIHEARRATGGGLRRVLDAMTDQLKYEQQQKYVTFVLKTAVDPLDWDRRVEFVRALISRLSPLVPDWNQLPAEAYVDRMDEIVKQYVQAADGFRDLIKTH